MATQVAGIPVATLTVDPELPRSNVVVNTHGEMAPRMADYLAAAPFSVADELAADGTGLLHTLASATVDAARP